MSVASRLGTAILLAVLAVPTGCSSENTSPDEPTPRPGAPAPSSEETPKPSATTATGTQQSESGSKQGTFLDKLLSNAGATSISGLEDVENTRGFLWGGGAMDIAVLPSTLDPKTIADNAGLVSEQDTTYSGANLTWLVNGARRVQLVVVCPRHVLAIRGLPVVPLDDPAPAASAEDVNTFAHHLIDAGGCRQIALN